MTEIIEDGAALVVRMYTGEKMGLRAIEKALKISDSSVRRILVANGVTIRPAIGQSKKEHEERLRRDIQVRDVGAMLADLLPEGGRVEAKKPSMTSESIARAACPYARVTVWLSKSENSDFIDGATFCAMHCESGACQTEPSRLREEAFRRYVARRIREASVIARQDGGVKERRHRMEMANETMLQEVNTREMEGAR